MPDPKEESFDPNTNLLEELFEVTEEEIAAFEEGPEAYADYLEKRFDMYR